MGEYQGKLSKVMLRLRLKLNPSRETLERAIEASLDLAVRASLLMISKGICPSKDAIKKLADRGLYEPILILASSGCSIESSILMDAFRFFMLEGDRGKALKLQQMIGLSLPDPQSIVTYCSGHRRIIDWDGFIIDSKNLPSDAASRVLMNSEWDATILKDAWGASILSWNCNINGVDAKRIARIVMPDVPISISSLSYHLDEDPHTPTRVIRKVASFFLEVGDKVWLLDGVPENFKGLEVFRGITRIPYRRCIIITDRPKAYIPLLKPYRINIEEIVGMDIDDSILAIRMLETRMGDPARAYYYSAKRGDHKLASMIVRSIEPRREPEPLPTCIQVEPQDIGWLEMVYPSIFDERDIIVDCISPTLECLRNNKLNKYEEKLVENGVNIPRPKKINGRKIYGRARYYVPDSLKTMTGISGMDNVSGVKVIDTNGSTNPLEDIITAASVLNRRGLIIVPGKINLEIAKQLGLPVIEDDRSIDEWLDKEDIAVVAWDTAKERPDIVYSASDSIVVLYPESLVKSKVFSDLVKDSKIDGLQVLEDSAIEMSSKLGKIVLSRTLKFNDNLEKIKIKNNGSSIIKMNIDDSIVYSEFEITFKELWGRNYELRKHQAATLKVLSSYYSRLDPGIVLSIYPTGSGKSAIYQVAGKTATDSGYGGYTLIVSPLKSLMNDQVENAINRGLIAYKIDSSVSKVHRRLIIDAARKGLIDLLYITPERFQDPELEALLDDTPPSLIVLDEAHTLSSWGNTFRPGYLYMAKRIYEYTRSRRWPPIALFTATAPQHVVSDIMESLGVENYIEKEAEPGNIRDVRDPIVLRIDPIRDELIFNIEPGEPGEGRLKQVVEKVRELSRIADSEGKPWIGIVFTGYVKSERMPWANADSIAKAISKETGIPVEVYHGQLTPAQRRTVEKKIRESIERGDRLVLVATKAFGMGVDIPVIRWILHAYPSDSPEDFYQEAGRAGRDGKRSYILVLYNPSDFEVKKKLLLMQRIRPSQVIEVYNMLVRLTLRTKYKGKESIALPVNSLLPGGDSIKALDILRTLGLLDYWIVNEEMAAYRVEDIEAFDDYSRWYWRLDKDIVISHLGIPRTKLWRKERLKIESCRGSNGREIRIIVGDREIASGDCIDKVWEYKGEKTPIAIIEFPIRKPKEIAIPGAEDFIKLVRRSNYELESLDMLMDMMENALSAKAIGGEPAVDKAIKEWIRQYLENRHSRLKSARIKGSWKECVTIGKCIDDILRDIEEAVKTLGVHGITLAVKDQDIAYRLKQELVARGIGVEPSIAAYRRILNQSMEPEKLIDNGYIVVVAREAPSTLAALERLEKYPYRSVYITKT